MNKLETPSTNALLYNYIAIIGISVLLWLAGSVLCAEHYPKVVWIASAELICIQCVLGSPLKTNHCVCWILFPEFAENGSIYDYIHVKKKQSSLKKEGLSWLKQVAEGTFVDYMSAY